MAKGFDKGGNTAARFDPKAFHDPFGLDHGEARPSRLIQLDGGFQSEAFLDGSEPKPVMSQPIEGRVAQRLFEIFRGEILLPRNSRFSSLLF